MHSIPKYGKICLLTACIFLNLVSYTQCWDVNFGRSILSSWSLNINAGFTSYYGDISIYDSDLVNKFSEESGPAYSFIVSKKFNSIIRLSGQVLSGQLQGSNKSYGFNTRLLEYNLHVRINVKNIIFPKKLKRFGLIGLVGVGQFLFKTDFYYYNDGTRTSEVHDTGVPEFVYFFGGGLQYQLSNKLCITSDLSLRHSQNDRLDNVDKSGNYDYYTYLGFGLEFNFGSSFRQPVKNKARIAHSTRKLKPLH